MPLHIGVNQLMLETPLDNEQRELTDLIKVSADSLLSLINDILDLTRVESGKLELEYFDFDVRTTAGRSLRTSRVWLEAPSVALEQRPSARSAVSGAEPRRVRGQGPRPPQQSRRRRCRGEGLNLLALPRTCA